MRLVRIKRRKNPEMPTWLIAVVGLGVVGGAFFWWRSRDKANNQAMATATKSAIISAVPPQLIPSVPGLTPAQVKELMEHPQARSGAGHFNVVQAIETQANTGAGHF
jgi:Flp pilus assembly protein TadB